MPRPAAGLVTTALAALLTAAIVGWLAPVADGAAEADGTTATAVASATLTWGLSDEASNAAFAPGTVNLLSAGEVADPGRGGSRLTSPGRWNGTGPVVWHQRVGDVQVVQARAGGTRPATWETLSRTPDGRPLGSPTSGTFSDHRLVFGEGTGWVDPGSGRASVRWDGDATVLSYSGMSYVVVSDPQLVVTSDGTGQLTATVGGHATSQLDPDLWEPLRDERVVLADLEGLRVTTAGVSGTPEYADVAVDLAPTSPVQVRDGRWGAWPQSFVTYLEDVGQAAYWYTSGGSTDAFKDPLPLTARWVAGGTVEVPPGDPADPGSPDPPDGGPTEPTTEPTLEPTDQPTPEPTPTGEPTTDGPGEPVGPVEVDDAQLRWAMSAETGNAAFAPGTVNLMSAGVLPDPGRGGETIDASAWRAVDGDVTIEKPLPDGGTRTATWADTSTSTDGDPLGSPTSGEVSGLQVVLDGGTGRVDVEADDARVTWDGSWSIAYYSGMTYFTVTDPALRLDDGAGTLTGTLGGFGTSMDDPTLWEPLEPDRVVLADLTDVDLDEAGLTVTPSYLGVRYDSPRGAVPQRRDEPAVAGSFPTSFVDFQQRVGQGAYWYSSGGATDRLKLAAPLTVSVDASAPVAPPEDPEQPAVPPPTEVPTPPSTDAPDPVPTSDPTEVPAPIDPPTVPAEPGGSPADSGSAEAGATTYPVSPSSSTVLGETTTTPVAASAPAPPRWPWWVGGGLLALAAAVAGATALRLRRPARG